MWQGGSLPYLRSCDHFYTEEWCDSQPPHSDTIDHNADDKRQRGPSAYVRAGSHFHTNYWDDWNLIMAAPPTATLTRHSDRVADDNHDTNGPLVLRIAVELLPSATRQGERLFTWLLKFRSSSYFWVSNCYEDSVNFTIKCMLTIQISVALFLTSHGCLFSSLLFQEKRKHPNSG